MQKAALYRSLRHRNLEEKVTSHLKERYEFARKSRLCESLVELILDELDRDEAERGIRRVKPWQVVFRQGDETALLTLLTEKELDRSMRGAMFSDVRKTIETRCLSELQSVLPHAKLKDLRTMINVRCLTREQSGRPKREDSDAESKDLRDPLADPPKLVDVHRFAKGVTRRQMSPADGIVASRTLSKLTEQLWEDYNVAPKIGQMLVEDIAAIRAECLPRLDEMKHGQVLVLATGIHERTGPTGVPRQLGIQPVILTLFTEGEREVLSSKTVTFPEARATQLKQIVRVHVEAYAQGGLLSQVDSQWLFLTCYCNIGTAINEYELRENVFVPTPGTVLDAGDKVTHKAIIVRLHLDGLTTREIARRTYHTEKSVDNYIGTFDQVALLYWYGVSRLHMRVVLRRSLRLIDEYLALVKRHFKDRDAVTAYLRSRGIRIA